MADGTQAIESKIPHLADKALLIFNAQGTVTAEQFDQLSLLVGRALALSDVLNTMANGGEGVDALHEQTLSTYSGMLFEVLSDARGLIDGTFKGSTASKAVAHG